MANSFSRQIRLFAYFLIGFAFAINSVLAFAEQVCYPKTKWVAAYSSDGGVTTKAYMGDTKADVCSKLPNGPWTTGDTCWKYTTPYTGSWVYVNVNTKSICDDGTDPVGGVCKCPNPCQDKAGMYYNNGQYSKSNLAGGDGAFSGSTNSSSVPPTFCIESCQMMTENLEGGAAGNYWYGRGNPQFSGKACDVSDVPGINKPPPSPEYDCAKAGKGFGYFNGNVVCTDINNTQSKDSKTKTTTNPDGSKTQVKTDTTVKCDGTVCTTTTTTTTTTYDSSGTQTGTTTKTDSTSQADPSGTGKGTKGDSAFCSENPTSPMCKEGSFTGSCTSEPACDGDPVQCATARATWKTRCALEPTQDAITKGQQVLDGDQQAADALKKTSVAMPTVDTAGGGGGGSCPADKSINVYGEYTVKLPLSSLCGAADLMRIALLAIAGFAAAMIITGGIK